MKKYIIAESVLEDSSQMHAIETEAFGSPWSEKLLCAEIIKKDALCLCAKYKDEVLGFIILDAMFDEVHITNIAVKSEYRRAGIGEGLLTSALRAAHHAGFNDITLEVRVSNKAAIKLYEKAGFISEGVR